MDEKKKLYIYILVKDRDGSTRRIHTLYIFIFSYYYHGLTAMGQMGEVKALGQ